MSAETYSGNLGDMLLRDGLVTDETLEDALARQRRTSEPLGRILVEMNAITEKVKLSFFQKRFGYDIVSLRDHDIPDNLYSYIPKQTAVKFRVVPYKLEGESLVVAMEDPSDLVVLDNLKAQVGLKIRPMIASYGDIEAALEEFPADEEGGAIPVDAESPIGITARLVKYLFFPVVAFTPLCVVIFMLIFSDRFQLLLLHPPGSWDTGDMILCITLIWGLWALFVYEIDGILINPEHRERR
jgi:hypothetical protein